MASSGQHQGSGPITGINVTPLVDITLVLLIIFMVTAKLVVSRAMPMDLPRAATGGEAQTTFNVSLHADGTTRVAGEPIAHEAELLARARRALESQPEARTVIDADGTVPHQRVMRALDVLRQAGHTRLAFGVAPGAPVAEVAAP
jgi:biopolymer transport protein ExbD